MKLTADKVMEIAKDCLFADGESMDNAVMVDGIVNRYAFHPDRIKAHADEIKELLLELPDEFQMAKGGGWSFLNACMDRHGNHWAEHPTMGMLFALGEAVGSVKCLMPRDMWNILPGGVPYYGVTV